MADITCPKCGTVISLAQSEIDAVVHQVRDEEFERELAERLAAAKAESEREQALAEEKMRTVQTREAAEKDSVIAKLSAQLDALRAEGEAKLEAAEAQGASQIATLKAQAKSELSQAVVQATSERDARIAQLEARLASMEKDATAQSDALKAQMEAKIAALQERLDSQSTTFDARTELAVREAQDAMRDRVLAVERERDEAQAQVERQKEEARRVELEHEAALREKLDAKDALLAESRAELERVRDMKARLNTKLLGETLEQHCEVAFNQLRAVGFQHAYFEKDNDSSDGSKGDYIYRETDENGVELISIMFEMKNEEEGASHHKKNEDHFKKLDADRRKKNCEYAILVSMLEPESELYNAGIVDVSHRYDKMYVIRPQFFIPIITLLRNAARNSMEARKELELARRQNIDVTNFEASLDDFKTKFGKNWRLAHEKFDKAIEEIDKTIALLERVKADLAGSDRNLRLANDKLDDLTVKKLVRKNPTMKAMFDALADEAEVVEVVDEVDVLDADEDDVLETDTPEIDEGDTPETDED